MITIRLNDKPHHEIEFLNAAPSKKRAGSMYAQLPFIRGEISGLPPGAPTIVATGDLQGRTDYGDTDETLLGCSVADKLPEIHEAAGLPAPSACLGILAGDFYTVPNATSRGGTGDVSEVWYWMNSCFSHVVGVYGNHDLFGSGGRLNRAPNGCLDGKLVEVAGLRVGGISGVIGNPDKENRKESAQYVEILDSLLSARPHIVVMHASPHIDESCPGSAIITETLERSGFAGLIVCGHVPWQRRVRECGRAICLNAHEAVVTLTPA